MRGASQMRCTGARASLDRLLHLAALQAAGADVCPGRLAAQEDANPLEVRVEAALRGHHRVAPVVTEARFLPANGADLGHRPGSVAKRRYELLAAVPSAAGIWLREIGPARC